MTQTKKTQPSQKEGTMTPITTTHQGSKPADDKNTIRPFHINVPKADLTDLRKRINATKWPERETVGDASQGVQLDDSGARALLGDRV
jgi:hypothetical protein